MPQQRTIPVNGMTCDGCEQSVQSALTGLDGVHNATADHTLGSVQVRFDDTIVTKDAIREQIQQAGYTVPT